MIERLEKLATQAQVLSNNVSGLAMSVDHLDRRTKRSERVLQMTVFGLALDFVLSLLVAFALLNANQAVRQGEVTRSEVLCPLYARFLGNYAPETRNPGPDRDNYIENFHVIQQGYGILHCTNEPVAPANTVPAPTVRGK